MSEADHAPRQTFSLDEAALYLDLNRMDAADFLRRFGVRTKKGIPIERVAELLPWRRQWIRYYRQWLFFETSNPRFPQSALNSSDSAGLTKPFRLRKNRIN